MAAGAETSLAAGVEAKPSPVLVLILGLAMAALALVCVFQGIQQILIPYQVLQIDAAHKVGVLALLTTLAAAHVGYELLSASARERPAVS